MRMVLFPDCFFRYFWGYLVSKACKSKQEKKTKKPQNKIKPSTRTTCFTHLSVSCTQASTSTDSSHCQVTKWRYIWECANLYARGCNKTPSQPIISDLLHLYLSYKIRSSLLWLLRPISTSSKPSLHTVTLAIYPAICFHVFKIYIHPIPSLGLSWN